MSGGGGGAGGGIITDANARLLVEDGVGGPEDESTALRELPVLDWSGDSDISFAYEDGDALGVVWTKHMMGAGRFPYSYTPAHPASIGATDFVSEGALATPTLATPGPTSKHIVSSAGQYNTNWAVTPSEFRCGIGGGSWSGWYERERWYRAIVPAHPADMAGITFSVHVYQDSGLTGKSVHVRVRDAAPTDVRQGAVVATIQPSTIPTVYVPAANIPDEGGELWIGFAPAWQADYEMSGVEPVGYPVACDVGYHAPELNNAKMTVVSFSDHTWQVYTDIGDALGTTAVLDDEDDPWTGDNTIIDMGGEGTPTALITDGTLQVTGPGGRCLAAIGELEDEDEPSGPWSEPYRVSCEFSVDELGDTMDSQASHIEFTTTRSGERLTGTVHFGDTTHAAGISVATPGGEAFTAVTITTDDRWAVRFDDRSEGYLRGKLWRLVDGEPAEWTVEVAVPDESDEEGDRFACCVRAQAGQTITLYPVTAMASAQGGRIHERLGLASGDQTRFVVSHQFVAGTVELGFAGVFAPPVSENGATCEVWTDYKPTAGMVVWATYLSEGA